MDSALDMGVTNIEHAKAPWPAVLNDSCRAIHEKGVKPESSDSSRQMAAVEISRLGFESVSLDRLRELTKKTKEKGAYLCPTLCVVSDLESSAIEQDKRKLGVETIPPQTLGMVRTLTRATKEVSCFFVREFAKHRVPMLVGQGGSSPGETLTEMKTLQANGVSPAEILRRTTIYPAKWLGVDTRLGSIAVGRQANLLVVRRNPLEDIGSLDSISVIIQGGRVVKYEGCHTI